MYIKFCEEISEIPGRTKETLTLIYNQINSAQLKRKIDKLRDSMLNLSEEKETVKRTKGSAKTGGFRVDSYMRH